MQSGTVLATLGVNTLAISLSVDIDQSPISQVRVKLTSTIHQTCSKNNLLIRRIGRIGLSDELNYSTSHVALKLMIDLLVHFN